ncbi:hypothetical protein C7H19_07545 [Aphanothece hegewaldii CCALA 016]|uniref:DUF2281 domain-containing protein n=2 Tax=Aphanothece TaxID=1121 RepID=A0A2T1LZH8_9CHRO|nr:hypothetical protein [Aphanothece hegewaldii]PSF37829.1 hypothetical protein C7H19_07545 [Aphanothece hegewaldii CCALA 016]
MSTLLEQAICQLKNLPTNQQDEIALIILEEIEDELKWERSFNNSQDVLAKLATEALQEYQAGKTQELDPQT